MNNLFSANLKIIIADDHLVIQQGLSFIIKGFLYKATVNCANTVDATLDLLKQEKIDLLILDINMPGGNNFKMIEQFREIQPEIKILIFSAYEESTYGLRYLKTGVNGYLEKNVTEEEIQFAIKCVLVKGKYFSTSIQDQLFDTYEPKVGFKDSLHKLSNREMEVARLIVIGESTNSIGEKLNLQNSTVSTHKKKIFDKLGVAHVSGLIDVFKLKMS